MGVKDKRLWFAAAAIWGFAEATFFFIVPDVLLTASVFVFGIALALRLSLAAAAGAVVGGLIMFSWGASDIGAARAFVGTVPLIGDDLLMRVNDEIAGAWGPDLAVGAVTGAPYKIYAAEAGAAGLNPAVFALVSFLARLARFALAVALTAGAFRMAERFGLARWRGPGLALSWAVLYAAYAAHRLSIS
jgi:membrane protein YqaA with SNARE-associated domain